MVKILSFREFPAGGKRQRDRVVGVPATCRYFGGSCKLYLRRGGRGVILKRVVMDSFFRLI